MDPTAPQPPPAERSRFDGAPEAWYSVVIIPIAFAWAAGIPLAAFWLLPVSVWWALPAIPVWAFLTGRVHDRWIPQLLAPAIDRLYRAAARPAKPESATAIALTTAGVEVTRPGGATDTVRWVDLRTVEIETNALGPLAPDQFWVLHARQHTLTFPVGATGDRALSAHLGSLPGYDSSAFIEAMASTSEARFTVWRGDGATPPLHPSPSSSTSSGPQTDHPHTMSKPLTIVANIFAKPDRVDLVKAELQKLVAPTLAEAGCINYDLHQDNEDPAHFLFFENWESRELWLQHMDAPHIAAYKAATEGAVADFTLHEMTPVG